MAGRSLEWVAPRVLAGVGLLLIALACYMAGADSLTCGRTGDRVDCRVVRSRWLGSVAVEQTVVSDVVDAWVRTSTTSEQTYRSGRGSNAQHTSSNDTLMLHTRDNRDVATLGGDQSAAYAEQLAPMLKPTVTASAASATRPGGADVTVKDELSSYAVSDSYIPIALLCAGLGAALAIFGIVAIRLAR
jgi:hypothetical protein